MTAEQAFEPFSGIVPYPFDDFKDSADPDSRPLTLVRGINARSAVGSCAIIPQL